MTGWMTNERHILGGKNKINFIIDEFIGGYMRILLLSADILKPPSSSSY